MPAIQGVNHVALSVSDAQRSGEWYTRVFGVSPMMEEKSDEGSYSIMMIGSSLVGVFRKPPDAGDAFSEFRTGLDHLAFGAATKADVEEWKAHLDSLGIANSGVIDDEFGSHLNFRDPDNIALEIFAALA